MPDPFEPYAKKILVDGFKIDEFITNHFVGFWRALSESLTARLEKMQKNKQKKLTKAEGKKVKPLITCLSMIVAGSKAANYSAKVNQFVTKSFSMLLDHDTLYEWRIDVVMSFLRVITMVSEDVFLFMQPAVALLVPWTLCTANNDDITEFRRSICSQSCSFDDGSRPSKPEDAHECLTKFLHVMKLKWMKSPEFVIEMLFKHVIGVMYKGIGEEYGLAAFAYGYKNGPSDAMRALLIEFFQDVITCTLNLGPMLEKPQRCLMLLVIFRDAVMRGADVEATTVMFELLLGMIKHPKFSLVLADSPDHAREIMKSVAAMMNVPTDMELMKTFTFPQEILVNVREFGHLIMNLVLEKLPEKANVRCIVQMMSCLKYSLFQSALMIYCLLHVVVTTGKWIPEAREIIRETVKENDVLAAVVAKYGQYLAVCVFHEVSGINKETVIDECSEYVVRMLRLHHVFGPKDFITENVGKMIDCPDAFVRSESVAACYYNADDWLVKLVPIGPLVVPSFDEANQMISRFLDLGQSLWTSDDSGETDALLLYVPIHAFAQTIMNVKYLPFGIECDRTTPYRLCSRVLLNIMMCQRDTTLQKMTLGLIVEMFNDIRVYRCMTEDDLTGWYTLLCFALLNKDKELRNAGFKACVETILMGCVGSSMLCNLVMCIIERGYVEMGDLTASFVGSLPLFEVIVNIPDGVLQQLKQRTTKYAGIYLSDTSEIIEYPPGDLRSRAIDVIKQIQTGKDVDPEGLPSDSTDDSQRAIREKEWDYSIPTLSILLADAMAREEPDIEIVGYILETLIGPLKQRSMEAAVTIQALLVYSKKLIELVPDGIVSFVETVVNTITAVKETDESGWAHQMFRTTADLLVNFSVLLNCNQSYATFVEFLISGSSNPAYSDSERECMVSVTELLATLYGTYPFQESVYFPCRGRVFHQGNRALLLSPSLDSLVTPQTENPDLVLACRQPVGQFNWRFKEVIDSMYEPEEVEPFTLPLSSTSTELELSIESPREKDFVSIFNQAVDAYESGSQKLLILNELHDDDIDEVSDKLVMIESMGLTMEPDDFPPPVYTRPKINAVNRVPGALTACGLFQNRGLEETNVWEIGADVALLLNGMKGGNYRNGSKIAVVYVTGDGNQHKILATTFKDTSPHFREFVAGLGWSVNLAAHSGYDGGLDTKNLSCGTSSVFYSDFSNEVMFHVAPLIPNREDDPQQVYKKRHIGNDHVHIVWVDAKREYDITTITSNFNKAHIVVYPLETGLFRVVSFWNNDVGWFGPIRRSVVVTKAMLPSLVRTSAMLAMAGYCRLNNYQNPQAKLSSEISKTVATLERGHSAGRTSMVKLLLDQ